jgi:hypothetical protein
MPKFPLSEEELVDLVSYLKGLGKWKDIGGIFGEKVFATG